MVLSTSFTKTFNLSVPVCLAPMAGVSGGRLAAAVARGGGLGVIGAGSGKNTRQLDDEIRIFRDESPRGAKLAIGINSWSALGASGYGVTQASLRAKRSSNAEAGGPGAGAAAASAAASVASAATGVAPPHGSRRNGGSGGGGGEESSNGGGPSSPEETCDTSVLQTLLERYQPHAIWFFAPSTPSKKAYTVCEEMGVEVIAQVGTVSQARAAVEMGASVVVAQGREAGGHGLRPEMARGTLPLAAAVAVELADTGRPVLAAGGVVSGRGLLAALALGCDGVVMGTRYCATYEALGTDDHKAKIVSTSGDETVRTRVYDMAAAVRPSNPVLWPEPYDSSGVASNDFTAQWHTKEAKLAVDLSIRDDVTGHSGPTARIEDAERTRDLSVAKVFMGEGAGLIYSVEGAEKITRDVVKEAEDQLDNINRLRTNMDSDPLPRPRPQHVSGPGSGSAGQRRPLSLSANNIDDMDREALDTLGLPRGKRSNTVSDISHPVRAPGTRQVISSGSSYEKMAGYSRAVRVGKHVQVAGTTAIDPDGSGVLCVGDVEGQTQYIFHIIALALKEARCSLENVVRTRMFVTDVSFAEKVMAEHRKVFSNIRPAATLVVVSALVHPELLVEVEADALEP
ncbi:unnamed protein product [Pylaiella littoralis]